MPAQERQAKPSDKYWRDGGSGEQQHLDITACIHRGLRCDTRGARAQHAGSRRPCSPPRFPRSRAHEPRDRWRRDDACRNHRCYIGDGLKTALADGCRIRWSWTAAARGVPGHAASTECSSRALLRAPIVEFGAGFCTALTNPITAGYFVAEFGGYLRGSLELTAVALAAIPVVALAACLSFSRFLMTPPMRRITEAWHRPIRLGTATVLVAMAGAMILCGV